MITDEQKLSLLQMGIKYSETYDEAHDIAEFIFGNEQQPHWAGFSNAKPSADITAETEDGQVLTAQPATAKENAGPAENGLYIAYMDGSFDRYTGENEVRGKVRGIGINHYDHFFVVALEDVGFKPLFKRMRSKDDTDVLYHPSELSALDDWDCVTNNANIELHVSNFQLPYGSHIPTLAQLALIGLHAMYGELNEALKFVGGEPIKRGTDKTSNYWSSSEVDQLNAWGLNMYLGMIYPSYNTIRDTLSIRPVYVFTH